MSRHLDLDVSYIVHAYTSENKTLGELAKELSCSETPIIRRLNLAGVELKDSRILPLSDDYIIRAYTIDEKTVNTIAKEMGCSPGTINNRLKHAGVKLGVRRRIKLSTEYLITEYTIHNRSARDIAQEFGCNAETISRRLKENGIKLRPVPESVAMWARSEKNRALCRARVGSKSNRWKGGKSFEPYCEKFNRNLKESVREKYERKCYLCAMDEKDNGAKLSIHHCDYNKMQGCGKRSWNLLPLCHHCHIKTNNNRWYWFALLYNHWATNSEFLL